jgi:hypothetical protein
MEPTLSSRRPPPRRAAVPRRCAVLQRPHPPPGVLLRHGAARRARVACNGPGGGAARRGSQHFSARRRRGRAAFGAPAAKRRRATAAANNVVAPFSATTAPRVRGGAAQFFNARAASAGCSMRPDCPATGMVVPPRADNGGVRDPPALTCRCALSATTAARTVRDGAAQLFSAHTASAAARYCRPAYGFGARRCSAQPPETRHSPDFLYRVVLPSDARQAINTDLGANDINQANLLPDTHHLQHLCMKLGDLLKESQRRYGHFQWRVRGAKGGADRRQAHIGEDDA